MAIGSPTWWYMAASVVHTFFDGNDSTGKMAVPFTMSSGWLGYALKDLEKGAS
ncbi:flavodoxin [Atopobium sp. oral taxon 416]|uniref:flavodoxin n=1 Tax=Atopobium sp. oral taxon 416 TaxID=712157 RepID=UPI001BAA909F|nr:flavodoxin [Atopobium sp. oral taxon 416]QUC03998.1 hypothetical protein J4859_03370 [Atopobium sp. oral taxon 416]